MLELATLKEYLSPNVTNILWMYFEGNDLNDLEIEINSKLLKNYLMDPKFSQNLKFKQKNIDQIILKKIEKEKEEVVKNFKVEFIKFIKLFNLREMIFFKQT